MTGAGVATDGGQPSGVLTVPPASDPSGQLGHLGQSGQPHQYGQPSWPGTVFIGIPMAAGVRDVLRTDAFKTLRRAGVQLHLFTCAGYLPEFREEFGGPNVHFHAFLPVPGRLHRWIEHLVHRVFMLVLSSRTSTGRIYARTQAAGSPAVRRLHAAAVKFAALFGAPLLWLSRCVIRCFGPNLYRGHIASLRPDLVIGTRVLTLAANRGRAAEPYLDRYLIISAAKRKVPTMVLVPSWDNLTSKGFFPVRPDRITVWNETMRQEAVTVQGLSPERVRVTGAPQHDVYASVPYTSRDEFCATLGFDPRKPYLVYATQTEGTVPDEPQLAMDIAQAVRQRFGDSLQLLVRVHQLDRVERYHELRNLPGVTVDAAGTGRLGHYHDRIFDRPASERLADTLFHAAAAASTASSISIDAAAVGTPVIGTCFDAGRPRPYERSVRRYFDFTHQANLVRSGGLRLASDMSQLLDAVNRYLKDRSLDSEARSRMVREQAFRVDGQSGRRVGEAVLGALRESRSPWTDQTHTG